MGSVKASVLSRPPANVLVKPPVNPIVRPVVTPPVRRRVVMEHREEGGHRENQREHMEHREQREELGVGFPAAGGGQAAVPGGGQAGGLANPLPPAVVPPVNPPYQEEDLSETADGSEELIPVPRLVLDGAVDLGVLPEETGPLADPPADPLADARPAKGNWLDGILPTGGMLNLFGKPRGTPRAPVIENLVDVGKARNWLGKRRTDKTTGETTREGRRITDDALGEGAPTELKEFGGHEEDDFFDQQRQTEESSVGDTSVDESSSVDTPPVDTTLVGPGSVNAPGPGNPGAKAWYQQVADWAVKTMGAKKAGTDSETTGETPGDATPDEIIPPGTTPGTNPDTAPRTTVPAQTLLERLTNWAAVPTADRSEGSEKPSLFERFQELTHRGQNPANAATEKDDEQELVQVFGQYILRCQGLMQWLRIDWRNANNDLCVGAVDQSYTTSVRDVLDDLAEKLQATAPDADTNHLIDSVDLLLTKIRVDGFGRHAPKEEPADTPGDEQNDERMRKAALRAFLDTDEAKLSEVFLQLSHALVEKGKLAAVASPTDQSSPYQIFSSTYALTSFINRQTVLAAQLNVFATRLPSDSDSVAALIHEYYVDTCLGYFASRAVVNEMIKSICKDPKNRFGKRQGPMAVVLSKIHEVLVSPYVDGEPNEQMTVIENMVLGSKRRGEDRDDLGPPPPSALPSSEEYATFLQQHAPDPETRAALVKRIALWDAFALELNMQRVEGNFEAPEIHQTLVEIHQDDFDDETLPDVDALLTEDERSNEDQESDVSSLTGQGSDFAEPVPLDALQIDRCVGLLLWLRVELDDAQNIFCNKPNEIDDLSQNNSIYELTVAALSRVTPQYQAEQFVDAVDVLVTGINEFYQIGGNIRNRVGFVQPAPHPTEVTKNALQSFMSLFPNVVLPDIVSQLIQNAELIVASKVPNGLFQVDGFMHIDPTLLGELSEMTLSVPLDSKTIADYIYRRYVDTCMGYFDGFSIEQFETVLESLCGGEFPSVHGPEVAQEWDAAGRPPGPDDWTRIRAALHRALNSKTYNVKNLRIVHDGVQQLLGNNHGLVFEKEFTGKALLWKQFKLSQLMDRDSLEQLIKQPSHAPRKDFDANDLANASAFIEDKTEDEQLRNVMNALVKKYRLSMHSLRSVFYDFENKSAVGLLYRLGVSLESLKQLIEKPKLGSGDAEILENALSIVRMKQSGHSSVLNTELNRRIVGLVQLISEKRLYLENGSSTDPQNDGPLSAELFSVYWGSAAISQAVDSMLGLSRDLLLLREETRITYLYSLMEDSFNGLMNSEFGLFDMHISFQQFLAGYPQLFGRILGHATQDGRNRGRIELAKSQVTISISELFDDLIQGYLWVTYSYSPPQLEGIPNTVTSNILDIVFKDKYSLGKALAIRRFLDSQRPSDTINRYEFEETKEEYSPTDEMVGFSTTAAYSWQEYQFVRKIEPVVGGEMDKNKLNISFSKFVFGNAELMAYLVSDSVHPLSALAEDVGAQALDDNKLLPNTINDVLKNTIKEAFILACRGLLIELGASYGMANELFPDQTLDSIFVVKEESQQTQESHQHFQEPRTIQKTQETQYIHQTVMRVVDGTDIGSLDDAFIEKLAIIMNYFRRDTQSGGGIRTDSSADRERYFEEWHQLRWSKQVGQIIDQISGGRNVDGTPQGTAIPHHTFHEKVVESNYSVLLEFGITANVFEQYPQLEEAVVTSIRRSLPNTPIEESVRRRMGEFLSNLCGGYLSVEHRISIPSNILLHHMNLLKSIATSVVNQLWIHKDIVTDWRNVATRIVVTESDLADCTSSKNQYEEFKLTAAVTSCRREIFNSFPTGGSSDNQVIQEMDRNKLITHACSYTRDYLTEHTMQRIVRELSKFDESYFSDRIKAAITQLISPGLDLPRGLLPLLNTVLGSKENVVSPALRIAEDDDKSWDMGEDEVGEFLGTSGASAVHPIPPASSDSNDDIDSMEKSLDDSDESSELFSNNGGESRTSSTDTGLVTVPLNGEPHATPGGPPNESDTLRRPSFFGFIRSARKAVAGSVSNAWSKMVGSNGDGELVFGCLNQVMRQYDITDSGEILKYSKLRENAAQKLRVLRESGLSGSPGESIESILITYIRQDVQSLLRGYLLVEHRLWLLGDGGAPVQQGENRISVWKNVAKLFFGIGGQKAIQSFLIEAPGAQPVPPHVENVEYFFPEVDAATHSYVAESRYSIYSWRLYKLNKRIDQLHDAIRGTDGDQLEGVLSKEDYEKLRDTSLIGESFQSIAKLRKVVDKDIRKLVEMIVNNAALGLLCKLGMHIENLPLFTPGGSLYSNHALQLAIEVVKSYEVHGRNSSLRRKINELMKLIYDSRLHSDISIRRRLDTEHILRMTRLAINTWDSLPLAEVVNVHIAHYKLDDLEKVSLIPIVFGAVRDNGPTVFAEKFSKFGFGDFPEFFSQYPQVFTHVLQNVLESDHSTEDTGLNQNIIKLSVAGTLETEIFKLWYGYLDINYGNDRELQLSTVPDEFFASIVDVVHTRCKYCLGVSLYIGEYLNSVAGTGVPNNGGTPMVGVDLSTEDSPSGDGSVMARVGRNSGPSEDLFDVDLNDSNPETRPDNSFSSNRDSETDGWNNYLLEAVDMWEDYELTRNVESTVFEMDAKIFGISFSNFVFGNNRLKSFLTRETVHPIIGIDQEDSAQRIRYVVKTAFLGACRGLVSLLFEGGGALDVNAIFPDSLLDEVEDVFRDESIVSKFRSTAFRLVDYSAKGYIRDQGELEREVEQLRGCIEEVRQLSEGSGITMDPIFISLYQAEWRQLPWARFVLTSSGLSRVVHLAVPESNGQLSDSFGVAPTTHEMLVEAVVVVYREYGIEQNLLELFPRAEMQLMKLAQTTLVGYFMSSADLSILRDEFKNKVRTTFDMIWQSYLLAEQGENVSVDELMKYDVKKIFGAIFSGTSYSPDKTNDKMVDVSLTDESQVPIPWVTLKLESAVTQLFRAYVRWSKREGELIQRIGQCFPIDGISDPIMIDVIKNLCDYHGISSLEEIALLFYKSATFGLLLRHGIAFAHLQSVQFQALLEAIASPSLPEDSHIQSILAEFKKINRDSDVDSTEDIPNVPPDDIDMVQWYLGAWEAMPMSGKINRSISENTHDGRLPEVKKYKHVLLALEKLMETGDDDSVGLSRKSHLSDYFPVTSSHAPTDSNRPNVPENQITTA